jgi:Domain of unknown function (DUF5615)
MTQALVYPRRFCLDANLSHRAAEALSTVGLPFGHVSQHFPHPTIPGRCAASDETLIEWAGETETVLMTADRDFEGVWVRQGTMKRYGVEVIVFGFMPERRPVYLKIGKKASRKAR